MRNNFKNYLAIVSLFFSGIAIQAQEITLHNMDFVGQRHSLNPALNPTTRFYLGGSAGAGFSSTSISVNSARRFEDGSDSFYWSPKQALNGLGRNNAFRLNGIADFSFGLKVNPKLFVHMAIADKMQMRLNYPKDLFSFIIDGNLADNNVGQTLNIGGFRANGTYYRDYSIGASYQVNCNLTVGGRGKFLRGIANLNTQEARFNITTDNEYYQITMENDLSFRTSYDTSWLNGNTSISDFFGRKNSGFGLDLGATYTMLNNKLLLTASMLDLGYITWREDNRRHYNAAESKTFTFNGLNESSFANDTDFAKLLLDTVLSTFDLTDESIGNYRTGLTTKMYFSGTYELAKGNKVGAMVYAEIANRRINAAWSVNGQMRLGKILNLQGNVSLMNKRISNIGLGLAANLGPVQIWAVTNNAAFLFFDPMDTRTVHFRAGVNIVWGYGKDKKNPCSPDYIPPGERGKNKKGGEVPEEVPPSDTPPSDEEVETPEPEVPEDNVPEEEKPEEEENQPEDEEPIEDEPEEE